MDETGSRFLVRPAELSLHNVPDRGGGIPGNQRPDRLSEPLALPPVGIEPGQMQGDLIAAGPFCLAGSVASQHTPLAVFGTGGEEGDVLGVERAPERAGFGVEGEQFAALLAGLAGFQKLDALNRGLTLRRVSFIRRLSCPRQPMALW